MHAENLVTFNLYFKLIYDTNVKILKNCRCELVSTRVFPILLTSNIISLDVLSQTKTCFLDSGTDLA